MAYTTTEKFCSKYGKLKDFKTKNVIHREGRKRQPMTKPKSQDKSKVQLLMILVLLHTAEMHLYFSSSTNDLQGVTGRMDQTSGGCSLC